MFYADRVVSYTQFIDILEISGKRGLCNVPKAADIPDLTDGADIALTLTGMGHNFTEFKTPYHHLVEAVVLFGDYGRFEVDITDAVWRKLPTLAQWWESRPKLLISPEAFEEFTREDGDEDGTAGVREPAPAPTPSGDMQADLPSKVTVE